MSWVNTSPLVKTYTLEEFWALPDPPDRSKLELIAGVLYMSPPPEYNHDNIVTRLIKLITLELVRTETEGRLYVPRAAIWTDRDTYLEPDLFYLSAETEAALEPQHRTSADIVVEVISPGSAIYDRNTKADTYAALSVRELWLIDEIREEVEVRVLKRQRLREGRVFLKGEQLISSVLPELSIPVTNLFQD